MTRLTSDDIKDIPAKLKVYDDTLADMTGTDLKGIACRAYGLEPSAFMGAAGCTRIGIVPITWGQGIIPGFSGTVQAIAAHLGFTAYVTGEADVAGLSEAAEKGSDVIMLSDDRDFQAIDLKKGVSVHNNEATGYAFAAGLDLMAGGLKGKEALVVGCGPVGRQAGIKLLEFGADLAVADVDLKKARSMALMLKKNFNVAVRVAGDLHRALGHHRCILDATPAAGIMDTQHVAGDTLIAAPGVPLGLTPRALQAVSGRLLHDTLQLGVAAMLAGVMKKSMVP